MSIPHSRPAEQCETYRLPGPGDSDSVGWDRPWWGLEMPTFNKDPGDSYQEHLAGNCCRSLDTQTLLVWSKSLADCKNRQCFHVQFLF